VSEYKAGKVEFRNDPTGIVHAVVGKSSFDATKLVDNIRAFIDHIVGMQPSSVRGQYLKSISISGTMTPGVMVAG
jgi:large subunit ribosomal protein L1